MSFLAILGSQLHHQVGLTPKHRPRHPLWQQNLDVLLARLIDSHRAEVMPLSSQEMVTEPASEILHTGATASDILHHPDSFHGVEDEALTVVGEE